MWDSYEYGLAQVVTDQLSIVVEDEEEQEGAAAEMPQKLNEGAIRRVRGALKSLLSSGLPFVGCLTPQQHASVSQGRICSDKLYVLPH